jgi:hypothetical protein
MNENVEQWLTLSQLPWTGGFNDTAGIAFLPVKLTKSCSTGTLYSSNKGLKPLEESHFQATKRQIRRFVDVRYLSDDGLLTIE